MSYSDKQVSLMEENRRLSDEVARLRTIIEQAVSAPGKDWLEWQLRLGAALALQRGRGGKG